MENQNVTYYTIATNSSAEYKDRGSRFWAFAFPIQSVDDVKLHLKTLKAHHPKAVHHCYAYRLLYQNISKVLDD
jgi:Uncharacterized conserved protein